MVTLDKQVIITKEFVINSYEIIYVNLKLNLSAHIYIMILDTPIHTPDEFVKPLPIHTEFTPGDVPIPNATKIK